MKKIEKCWNLVVKITKEQWVAKVLLGYILFIAVYTIVFACTGGEKRLLTSNELGDFLAGTFAAPAFFILILGYIQQGKELQQNTAALQLQAKELRSSVEEYRRLVKLNEDEVIAKHFAVLPYLKYTVANLLIKEEQVNCYDENGEFEDIQILEYGNYQFTIRNEGECARHFSITEDIDQSVIFSQFEITKDAFAQFNIQLDPDEINDLKADKKYEKIYSLKYFDQFGKEFTQKVKCYIFHDFNEGDYYPSIKIYS